MRGGEGWWWWWEREKEMEAGSRSRGGHTTCVGDAAAADLQVGERVHPAHACQPGIRDARAKQVEVCQARQGGHLCARMARRGTVASVQRYYMCVAIPCFILLIRWPPRRGQRR